MSITARSAKFELTKVERATIDQATRETAAAELAIMRKIVAQLNPHQRALVESLVEIVSRVANDGDEGAIAFAIVQCKLMTGEA